MRTKSELFKILLNQPLKFGQAEFDELVNEGRDDVLDFKDIRHLLSEIYDTNEQNLAKVSSEANYGVLGNLNADETEKRNKLFRKRIEKFYQSSPNKKPKSIVAEGDSWFMFPLAVTDIIDWLNEFLDDHAIYSMAYGGDWLTNIVYEGKFIEELSVIRPDFFLISGGGNDLVGGNKLALMVDLSHNLKGQYPERFLKENYNCAEDFITKEFHAFILTLKLQYYLMFRSIRKSNKLREMHIITQGYDHALPRNRLRSFKWNPIQWMVNGILKDGRWLSHPLSIKGIPLAHQDNIIRLMIDKVNEMFIDLASQFDGVHHLDCRGVAKNEDDWFDELHLKSHAYEKVARGYQHLIKQINSGNDIKHLRVVDLT